MTKKILSICLVILFLVSAMSCKKWKNNRETLTSEDHTLAEASFNDIFRNLLTAASPIGELLTDSCFTIQKGGNTFPLTITIDFGNTGCEGVFQQKMQGRLIMVLSDSMNHTGATAAITPENFYSKDYRVEGEITLENMGLNGSGHPVYHVSVQNGVITAEEDKAGLDFTVSWNCEYDYELVERNNGQLMFDDLYHITGTASGVNQESRGFTATITEPLQKYFNCRWPGAGTTKIAADDLKERDLLYGDCEAGSTCCDNEATESVRWNDPTVWMK